jgi:hypothetical protein
MVYVPASVSCPRGLWDCMHAASCMLSDCCPPPPCDRRPGWIPHCRASLCCAARLAPPVCPCSSAETGAPSTAAPSSLLRIRGVRASTCALQQRSAVRAACRDIDDARSPAARGGGSCVAWHRHMQCDHHIVWCHVSKSRDSLHGWLRVCCGTRCSLETYLGT